ncbi:tonsoku-like protein [Thamnophis elegans]|uniref:tonsoku-like protein n=1 Tax=Thamnophis elegans TaxID=35005 RepID=UPI0013787912|nr:tonsoku-like protein [Thamnophis elegans]
MGDREVRHIQKSKEKAQRKGDQKEEAVLCNQLGEILARHGRFQEALEEHRLELRLLESVEDVIGCAVAHRKIGECLAELESYEAALKHQRRHLELACTVSSAVEQQRAWATIGRTYMFMAESDQLGEALQEAEKAFMKSLAVLEDKLEGQVPQREGSEMRARLYLNLGLIYDSLRNPAMRTSYFKKSIYISEQAHLSEDLFRAYFNLGNIHLREKEHSQAMRCLERARECACKMKEKYMESECYTSIAQVLLGLGDFVAAKRSLRKAYRLGSSQPQQRDSVARNLRYATKVSRLQEALEEAEAASDLGAALGLSEQLGDLFCKMGEYRRAAEAYEKQLGHAKALGRTEQELAVIHVSLAATFGDLKDHARAVQHYQAELALRRGNPLEEGKTWLNIALAKEEAGQSYSELEPCFQAALQAAQKAGDHKLELQILQHLQASQQRCSCPPAATAETSARLQSLCASVGHHSDGESSEEEELHNSQALEASDLELSDTDDEEDMEGYGKAVPGRRRINKWNQRNDKGETPLHRACIEGNLRQVQYFLEKGHPVNPRDYCGWTPLHEACNHGHLESVRLLLDHGAAIDDPGGPGCEGITPLHDALNCGHFEVAELLVQRGASVLLRNAKGLSPLGTLKAWVQLYGKDLDPETRHHCRAMESLLRKTAVEPGSRPPPPRGETPSQLFDAELCSPSPPPKSPGARQRHPEAEEDCMAALRPVKKKQRLLLEQTLAGEARLAPPADYQAAMLGLGSARLPPSPERHKAPPRSALIPADEYVGDDWLEDDLAPGTGSRKRSRWSPAGAWGSGSEDSEGGAPRQPPETTSRRRRRPARQTRLTLDRTLLGRSRGAGPPPREDSAAEPGSLLEGAGSSPTRWGDSPPLGAMQVPSPPVRVRVRVQDSVFLIPVPKREGGSRPVSWLAEQASQRYYQACGLLPRLTLKKEGALLDPQDSVLDVLQSNEEVLAEVQSWDLPPLLERYRKACQTLAVGEHPLLGKLLERQESASSFSVSGTALRPHHLRPLLRALKLQASLRQLSLSGTGLGDESAEELQATLGTIPGLKHLDLSANRLGPDGLQKLATGLPGSFTFQALEELDLSLNPLGDGSAHSVASLLQACPVLGTLRLQGCGLGATFLEPPSLLLASTLKGAVHLKRLALSHNALGPRGLGLLLKNLPFESLTHLEVGSLQPRAGDRPQLRDAVVSYLTQEGCVLTHLGLSGNHLDEADVSELARALLACPSLVSLDLSANPAIGILGLRTLLVNLEERKRGLQVLSLAGCSVRGPLETVTWTKLSSLVAQLQLCSRQLCRADQRDVAELWHSPANTALHSVTRHHKLFCQSL